MYRLTFFIIFFFTGFSASTQHRVDSLIQVLKKEIENQSRYVNAKFTRIAALQENLRAVRTDAHDQRFDIYNELYQEYKTFVNDSAFKYADKLLKAAHLTGDPQKINYAYVKLGFTLLSAGRFKETFDTLNSVHARDLPDTSRAEFYRLMARAYADLMIFNNHEFFMNTYRPMYSAYVDSALQQLKPGDYQYYYLTNVKNLHLQNYREVIRNSDEMVQHHNLTWPEYAVHYYDLAEAWRHLGDEERSVENLILSSIADVRGAVKETAAMYTLARELHKRGDSHNAYIFIRQSLADAQFYGARQRQVEINSILPVIAADELNTMDERRKRWVTYSGFITLIVVLTAVFSVIIYKQLQRIKSIDAEIKTANLNLKSFNDRLIEADRIKEEYVGYYFNMTTDYVNKIDVLRKQVMNLLVNDRKKDALTILGKYNPIDERAQFVKDFDRVFLRLFPDFVQQFNQLLDPQDPLIPENDGELNSDLRIFALIRLGISDNRKIGEILNLSVNTIYAYKTRVKHKALLPDDSFLTRVMEIKSVDQVRNGHSTHNTANMASPKATMV